jgi:hypothetical protein
MDVGGQLRNLAAFLLRKELLTSIGQKAVWAPDAVEMIKI